MPFEHQPPDDPMLTIVHTIGKCPYHKVGDLKLIGTVTKLVYTKLIGGTCKAYNQVALLVVKRGDDYSCVHPGWIYDCGACRLTSPGVPPLVIKDAGPQYPIAENVLTSIDHPITKAAFIQMTTTKHLNNRYDLLEL